MANQPAIIVVPCLLMFRRFQMVLPLGETAHHSNPSRRGDFALATGGQWKGQKGLLPVK